MYTRYVLPRLIEWACSRPEGRVKREMLIPMARGRVLEVGIGSGMNLPFYDSSRVVHLTGVDPMERLWKRNKLDVSSLGFELVYLRDSAEELSFEDNFFDTIVSTSTLCSIKNISKALGEVHRVLKPDGSFVFMEHGVAPDAALAQRQKLLNPMWKRIGGGCNLNRDIPGLLREAGFNLDGMSEGYQEGWRPTSYQYWGWAYKV